MSIQFLLWEVSECFRSDKCSLAISLRRRRTIRFTSIIILASVQKVKKMSNERFLRSALNTQKKREFDLLCAGKEAREEPGDEWSFQGELVIHFEKAVCKFCGRH